MLYSETPEIHMHTIKIGVLDVSAVEGGLGSICSAKSRIHGSWRWHRFAFSWWTSR